MKFYNLGHKTFETDFRKKAINTRIKNHLQIKQYCAGP